jgi:hypothetical protein
MVQVRTHIDHIKPCLLLWGTSISLQDSDTVRHGLSQLSYYNILQEPLRPHRPQTLNCIQTQHATMVQLCQFQRPTAPLGHPSTLSLQLACPHLNPSTEVQQPSTRCALRSLLVGKTAVVVAETSTCNSHPPPTTAPASAQLPAAAASLTTAHAVLY